MPRARLTANAPSERAALTVGQDYIGSAFSPTIEVEDVEGGHDITTVHMTVDGLVEQAVFVPDYSEEESARASAETAREAAEESRESHEDARRGAEALRADAEYARADAEAQRASQEAQRALAEDSRAEAETARASAESARASAETARAGAESQRASAETARAAAELARIATSMETVTSATASVGNQVGTPSVTVTLGEPAEGGRAAHFAFSNLKGETGDATLPNSVGTRELKDGGVTLEKIADGVLNALTGEQIDGFFE